MGRSEAWKIAGGARACSALLAPRRGTIRRGAAPVPMFRARGVGFMREPLVPLLQLHHVLLLQSLFNLTTAEPSNTESIQL